MDQKKNSCSESLDPLYTKYSLRQDCYQAITDHILKTLYERLHVCVVLYGHPGVFAQPGLDAVLQARKQGFYAVLLPGISAEDCLFADLLIDPGSTGCQTFEATDFLIYQRKFDTRSHLILWQVDIIGVLTNPQSYDNGHGAKVLVDYLSNVYPLNHEVILYEAAQYPSFNPKIQRLTLNQLPTAVYSRITTLYIPPLQTSICDRTMLDKLNITLDDINQKLTQ